MKTLAYLMGPRNREIIQVEEILKLYQGQCIIIYDVVEHRNSEEYSWNNIILRLQDKCKFIQFENATDLNIDYLLVTSPYQLKINKQFTDFIRKMNCKTIYLPYDLSTGKYQDLIFENNERYNCFANQDIYELFDSICVYDDQTFNMLVSKLSCEKLKRIGCPRYNGKPEKSKNTDFVILYNPRYCLYEDVNYSQSVNWMTNISDPSQIQSKHDYMCTESMNPVSVNTIVIPVLLEFLRRHRDTKLVIRFHPEFIIKNKREYNYIKLLCKQYNVIFDETTGIESEKYLKIAKCVISEYSSWNIDAIRYEVPFYYQVADYHRMLDIYQYYYENVDVIMTGPDLLYLKLEYAYQHYQDTSIVNRSYTNNWNLFDFNAQSFIDGELENWQKQ